MKKNVLFILIGVICACVIFFLLRQERGVSLAEEGLTDFRIQDTAMVGKIFIADNYGKVTLVRGDDGFWTIDDSLRVLPHQMKLILKTFKQIGIQSPVGKKQKQTAMQIINGDNRQVKIYDRDGKWMKTWYVGRGTKTSQGTFAILETPTEGVSPEPYIIEVRGFRGYLTTRFHSNVDEWRWTGVFYYPEMDLEEVKVSVPKRSEDGFSIRIGDRFKSELDLFDQNGFPVPGNKAEIGKYIGGFQSINLEHFVPDLAPSQQDSLRKQLPDYFFQVKDKKGVWNECALYFRPIASKTAGAMGDRAPEIDPERVYIIYKNEIASGQRLTFDKLLRTKSQLMGI